MAYVEKYRIAYSDPFDNRYWLKIYEDGFSGDLTYLTPSVATVDYKFIDNNENPYQPIQGSELEINFISENDFDLAALFASGSLTDTKYKVEWYSVTAPVAGTDISRLIWVGFLDTESCSEPIVDDPKAVFLRAVDGIGFLKNSSFTDENNEFQYGKYTLLQCLEWCIVKTELELDLHVSVSVFETSMSDRTDNPTNEPFKQCKIHTRSIKEKNCYEVIEAICKAFSATFYQENGVWKIDRKHDRWNSRAYYTTVYSYPYVSDTPSSNTYQYRHTSFTPVNVDHKRYFVAPYKECKTTYRYVVPADIPRNSTFQEGDFQVLLSDADNNAYTIDHWTLVKNIPEVSSTATPYRNDRFDPVSEQLIESTIRIPRDVSGTANGNRLRSTAVEVNEGDRLNLSAETRAKFYYDTGSSYFNIFYVRFVGVSSTVYTLQDQGNDLSSPNDECTWETGTGATLQFTWPPSADSDKWHTFSCRSEPFPEDGDLYIYLMGWDASVSANETWYKNVKVTFDLFMGATTTLKGQQAKITQDATYRGKAEEEISIGDSPKKIISGALFRATDDTELTSGWYLQGGPDSTLRPLLQYTNRATYQLKSRFKTKVEGTITGNRYAHPSGDGSVTILQPNLEMEYAPASMQGMIYIPTNLTVNSSEGVSSVFGIEFYNDTEAEDPLGDDETIQYLYE